MDHKKEFLIFGGRGLGIVCRASLNAVIKQVYFLYKIAYRPQTMGNFNDTKVYCKNCSLIA